MAQATRVLVVIATYNEIENIQSLLEQIHSRYPAVDVLVIDDRSPDGTGEWVARFAAQHRWCFIIQRSGKLGLGSAALAGFRWALAAGYTHVLTMDADFSHHPEDLGKLLPASLAGSVAPASLLVAEPTDTAFAAVSDGSSCIVIGSRYVRGGRIEGWPWSRRLASRWINRFARWWLRLPTRDNSGAFRCYPASLLQRLPLEQVRNQGYGYLEEILYLARLHGATFREVPITFRDRVHGQSKINAREAFLALWTLSGLPWRLGFAQRT
jgi:dolichol-phosphate mannosyltransferase